ncbi:tetratricopeptide repeat protein [bacterium SCSIO 12741]|nr:tetratricopeptide repeat protein [bacterium SCSIO 12741]
MNAVWRNPLYSFFIVVITCWLVYANSLGNQFALDDLSAITGNSLVQKGVGGIGEIWSHAYLYGFSGADDESYRPLPLTLHALVYGLTNNSPFAHHFLQVLLYSLFCGIGYLLLRKWMPDKPVLVLLLALVFAVHPLHTEVVANIKSLDELLSFGLGISALFLFSKYLENSNLSTLIASLGVYLLALLSKENAVTFVLLFPLAAWFFGSGNVRKSLPKALLFVAPVLVYFLLRSSVLSTQTFDGDSEKLSAINNALLLTNGFGEYLATAFAILLYYLKLLIFPSPLTYDYSLSFFEIIDLSSPQFWISALLYISILALAIWGLLKKQVQALGWLWFLITLSIYSNLVVSIASSAGERFLLTPSFGFILGLVCLIHIQLLKEKKPAVIYGILGLVILIFSVLTIQRNPVWENNDTLLLTDVKTSQNSFRANWFAGQQLKRQALASTQQDERSRLLQSSLNYLTKSYSIYSEYIDIYQEMADVLKNQGKWDKMLKVSKEGSQKFPEDEQISLQLGEAYLNLGQFAQARTPFAQLHHSSDTNFQYLSLFNTGATFLNERRFDSSRVYFDRARSIRPEFEEVNYYLAMSQFQLEEYDNAIRGFLKVTPENPAFAHSQSSIGTIYLIQGQFENALTHLKTALVYVPGDANILNNMAAAYHQLGNDEKAQECIELIGQNSSPQ